MSERIGELRRAAEILGAMPSGGLGTQEAEYRAFKILTDEIERLESQCDHIPMQAALDDKIGCIRCGKWLEAQ